MALSDQIQQRADLIGTQVITRNTGKKLGVVNQVWWILINGKWLLLVCAAR
jgi:sporulation protein YlmC with PRC-barrel domain